MKSIVTGTALLMLTASAASAKAPVCPPTTVFNTSLDHFEGYRVFTGPDGDSEVVPFRIDAKHVPMLNTGKALGLLDLPKSGPRAPQVVVGAADVDLPLHRAPYKELFLMLGGSITFKTAKFTAELGPGSMLLFEDVDARVGHGARTGPCGYVSLSIAP